MRSGNKHVIQKIFFITTSSLLSDLNIRYVSDVATTTYPLEVSLLNSTIIQKPTYSNLGDINIRGNPYAV